MLFTAECQSCCHRNSKTSLSAHSAFVLQGAFIKHGLAPKTDHRVSDVESVKDKSIKRLQ